MPTPEDLPIEVYIKTLQETGCVPLGVLYFDMERDAFSIGLFSGISREEFDALLRKLGLKFVNLPCT